MKCRLTTWSHKSTPWVHAWRKIMTNRFLHMHICNIIIILLWHFFGWFQGERGGHPKFAIGSRPLGPSCKGRDALWDCSGPATLSGSVLGLPVLVGLWLACAFKNKSWKFTLSWCKHQTFPRAICRSSPFRRSTREEWKHWKKPMYPKSCASWANMESFSLSFSLSVSLSPPYHLNFRSHRVLHFEEVHNLGRAPV